MSRQSLTEQVLQSLRLAIQTGQLKPGQRLVEAELANQLGVSRVPVREAIRALEREGLIATEVGRGASVVSPSEKDIEEVYGLRTALEVYAIELVIKRAGEDGIASLQAIAEQMLRREDADGELNLTRLDLRFHERLCELSGNRHLLEAWQRLSGQIRMILALKDLVYDDSATLRLAHERIVEAIRQRDVPRAQNMLREHVARSAEKLRQGTLALRDSAGG